VRETITKPAVPVEEEEPQRNPLMLIISIDRSIIGGLGSNPVSLRSIISNNRWLVAQVTLQQGVWRSGDLATKNTPKPKTAHVDTHVSGKICIVGTIKGHRAARNNNIAR
jgi:hypothetical protein